MKYIKISAAIIAMACTCTAFGAQDVMRFDFGSAEAAEGYTAVTSATKYDATKGYGFETGTEIRDIVNKAGDALTKDYVTASEAFQFSVKLPEGNYKVTVTLGDTEGTSKTTVKAENKRLMLESIETAPKETKTLSFNVNTRTPKLSEGNEMKLNSREWDKEKKEAKIVSWDDKLTLQFNDEKPCVCAIEIEPLENVITVFTIGDSTLTDGGGVWAQYIPRWFDGDVVVANHAENGMTIKGFRFGRRWDKVMECAKEGDYLFIQLGTNDQKSNGHDPMWAENDRAGDWVRTHSAAETDYIWGLATMAVEAKRHGMIPVIVSPLTKIDRMRHTTTDLMTSYGKNARKAAELADCAYIDLWGMSVDIVNALGEGALKVYSDGTHCDNYGGYLFALCIAKGIRENNLALKDHLIAETPEIDPKNPKPSFEEFTVPIEPRKMPEGAPQMRPGQPGTPMPPAQGAPAFNGQPGGPMSPAQPAPDEDVMFKPL